MNPWKHRPWEGHSGASFDVWMQAVTEALETCVGLHPNDLPDCPYADWHTAGLEPAEAARQALVACYDKDE